jgi:hypothetical protein
MEEPLNVPDIPAAKIRMESLRRVEAVMIPSQLLSNAETVQVDFGAAGTLPVCGLTRHLDYSCVARHPESAVSCFLRFLVSDY